MPRLLSFAILLAAVSGPLLDAAPPVQFSELTAARRERLDRLAMKATTEKPVERGVDLAGNATGWALKHWTLPASEEATAATESHKALLKQQGDKVLPTPAAAKKVFDRLVSELPPPLKPAEFQYTLTVLDRPDVMAFTSGGGYVYVTRGLVEASGIDRGRDPEPFAFLLAQELGHVSLGHSRRGYQLLQLQEQVKKGLDLKIEEDKVRSLYETLIAPAGKLATFLFSRDQEFDADLFALHLCRNAGFEEHAALDALRGLLAAKHPGALTRDDYRPENGDAPTLLEYYLSSHPDPDRRLKRLLLELRGAVEDDKAYGLFLYDPKTGKFEKCGDGSVAKGVPSLVFVHGLHGGLDSFKGFLSFMAEQEAAKGHALLAFRYPSNGSLALAGRFLDNELRRVAASPEKASFVCHSAGGLVFRYYAEKKGGAFDRAVTLGTPHGGSRMKPMKFIVDMLDFFEDFKLGLPTAVVETIREGRGDMGSDLLPDSLFLRHLGRDEKLAERYFVVHGRYFGTFKAAAIRTAFSAGKKYAKGVLEAKVSHAWLKDLAVRLLDEMELPEEIVEGDLTVATERARLKGAGREKATDLHHQALKSDEDVMKLVGEFLFERK